MLLSVFAAGCSPTQSSSLAVPPATTIATASPTLPPTLVPTATLSPTATVDPNMPAGATNKDDQGNWVKTAAQNGRELTYIYKQITPSGADTPVFSGWFRLLTPSPIPLRDMTGFLSYAGGPAKNIGPITVYVEEGVPGAESIASIMHDPTDSSQGPASVPIYANILTMQMGKRILGAFPTVGKVSAEKLRAYSMGLQDDDVNTSTIEFTVAGKQYRWGPGPDVGAKVYIMDWSDTVPTETNGFVEWKDFTNTDHYRSSFWGVDAKGNLLGAISSQKPLGQLSPRQIRWLVLYHSVAAIFADDLTDFGAGRDAYMLADLEGQGSHPSIVINKP